MEELKRLMFDEEYQKQSIIKRKRLIKEYENYILNSYMKEKSVQEKVEYLMLKHMSYIFDGESNKGYIPHSHTALLRDDIIRLLESNK